MKASIILPVYNVAPYLPKCLDSLLNQTLSDIEIICVNDGSKDNSLAVLEEYAARDARIVIIDQQNSGPGVARNRGIEAAKGEYIGFVDPDDWVDINMYEQMYNVARSEDADLIECGILVHNEKNNQTKLKVEFQDVIRGRSFNWQDHPAYLFQGITAAWNKFCRASLLKEKQIRFSSGYCAEDHVFTIALRLFAQKVIYLPQPFYHYLTRTGSLTQHLSTINLKVPLFLADVASLLQREGSYERLKELYINDAAGLAAIHYSKTPPEHHKEYCRLCAENLPQESYNLFAEFIRPYSFKDKIFSVRYKVKGVQRYRIITVLGVQIKLKA